MELVAFDTDVEVDAEYWNINTEYQEAMDTGSIKIFQMTRFPFIIYLILKKLFTSGRAALLSNRTNPRKTATEK